MEMTPWNAVVFLLATAINLVAMLIAIFLALAALLSFFLYITG